MRILCNLPLQCFDPLEAFEGLEILSYGPAERMIVDGIHYPPDVPFDPSTGSVEELLAALPAGFVPDMVLIYWPDQDPLPQGMERCPVPTVGIVSDYNLSLPYITGLWPFFDALLCDRAGVDLFQKLSFAGVRYFGQYSYKAPYHRVLPGVERDLDIAFAGNLNPVVQSERIPWLQRVASLGERGLRTVVTSGAHGPAYGELLNRARIGFNRSIRGEMNLRAFEVPACGALLFMEETNREVRDFFVPDEEVVLYGEDLEDKVLSILADEPRRARIAAAGHRRVQDYRMSRRIAAMLDLLGELTIQRPITTSLECRLARAIAMLLSWSSNEPVAEELEQLRRLHPRDPRILNALGLLATRGQHTSPDLAAHRFRQAMAEAPDYLPASANLTWLVSRSTGFDASSAQRELERRIGSSRNWEDLDGPVLPVGYSMEGILLSGAMAQAIREGDRNPLRAAFTVCLPVEEPTQPSPVGSSA